MGEKVAKDGLEAQVQRESTAGKPPPGGPGQPQPARRRPPDGQILERTTDSTCQERVRVGTDRSAAARQT